MDTLVSQYAGSRFEDEGYASDEQYELSQPTPSLSLKFALPPLSSVSYCFITTFYHQLIIE